MRRRATTVVGLLSALAGSLEGQGRISGTVFDSLDTRAPLAHAMVVLVESGRAATTDARGRFQFDGVAAGHYTLGFMHPLLDSLGITLPPVGVDHPAGARSVVWLATPAPATLHGRLCPDTSDTETGVVIGRVRDVDDDVPLAQATVRTSWTEFVLSSTARADRRVETVASTNGDGVYRLCGVPVRLLLDVEAIAGGFRAGPRRVAVDLRLVTRVDFAVTHKDSAARDSPAGAPARDGTASILGTVRDARGRAIRGATASVLGGDRSVRSDTAGAFSLTAIPAGTRTLETRPMGLPPETSTFDLPTGGARTVELTMTRSVPVLAPVTVVASRSAGTAMAKSGFFERRRQGLGAFMTAEEIARLHALELGGVLERMRGVRTVYWGGAPMPSQLGAAGRTCVPTFFVDGMVFMVDGPRLSASTHYPFSDLSGAIVPEFIRGIEIYSSPGTIPAQFDRSSFTGCGSVVIWTR